MKNIITLLILLFASTVFTQKAPYIIYNSKGKKVSYEKMMKALGEKDIILFGELHNNPISHWLQFELTSDLSETKKLTLGAEMYEADNQDELDSYLKGEIDYKALDTLARLWPNDKTDYAPLVDFAKEHKLKFIATNIPRRFASLVYKKGFGGLDSLSEKEKTWVATLPFPYDAELPTYKNILEMMGKHGTPELVMAQASKDATMAHFILKHFKEDGLFLHFNGAYHSDDYEGILWYLKQSNKSLIYGTITTVSQENVNELLEENMNKADFIICVDENMTSTY